MPKSASVRCDLIITPYINSTTAMRPGMNPLSSRLHRMETLLSWRHKMDAGLPWQHTPVVVTMIAQTWWLICAKMLLPKSQFEYVFLSVNFFFYASRNHCCYVVAHNPKLLISDPGDICCNTYTI